MAVALHAAVAARTNTGKIRSTNQDALRYSLDAGVFAVCDGMGGAAGGEIASRLAVDTFVDHLEAVSGERRTSKVFTQAVSAANRQVHGRALREPALRGMGTTLVALALRGGGDLALVHVGDSRCYRWARGVLEQLTEDHSLISEQIRAGVLTEEAAARSPMRNVITRAVGARRSVEPEVRLLTAREGDLFLLCSDGLTRELPDAAIAVLLGRPGTLEERNTALVEAALQAGGRDNVTSILVEV